MIEQQLSQISPVPTRAVYFLVSADGNQTMIIEKVPTRLADRAMLDIVKLVDRVSELAKRMNDGKEYRLVWNDDEDDIFVTLDTVKRMKAAIDFAMWQSLEKPIVRILAKPVVPSPPFSSSSSPPSWSSSSPSALSESAKEDEAAAAAASAADAEEDDDTVVASVVAFCVATVAGDAGDAVPSTAEAADVAMEDASVVPAAGPREDETAAVPAAVSDLLLEMPVEKKTPGRPKKRPSDAPLVQEKRRPGRPSKSILIDSTSTGQPQKKISDANTNNDSANSPSVRPRRKSSIVDSDNMNDVSMAKQNYPSMTDTPAQEKRKPGRPRKSNLAETSAASSPSVRERRKKIPVDENENNVAMAESTDQDTIKTEDCDEYDITTTETLVQGKRKPGRPRKRALIDSHVPNAPTVVKPPKTITDYFGSISVKYAGDTKQDKKRTGRSRKSIIVQSPGESADTIMNEFDEEKNKADRIRKSNIDTSNENEMTEIADKETRKSVRPRKSVMVEPTKENEISIKEKVLQEKSKPVRPRMSLPANFPVGQAGTNNENTVQERKRPGRPPRKSIVVNSPAANSPIVHPTLPLDNAVAETAPVIADKLAEEFEEWRGMRAAAAAPAAAATAFNPAAAAAAEDTSYAARAIRLLSNAVSLHENRVKEMEINQANIIVKTEFMQFS